MMSTMIGEDSWIRKLLITLPSFMHAEIVANWNQFDTHLSSATTSRSSNPFSVSWEEFDTFLTRATQWFHQDKGSSAGTSSDASPLTQSAAECLDLANPTANDIHKSSVGIGSQFSDPHDQDLRCALQLPRAVHTVSGSTNHHDHIGSETYCSTFHLPDQRLQPELATEFSTTPKLLNFNSWVALFKYIIEEYKDDALVSDVEELETKEQSIDNRSDTKSEFSLDLSNGEVIVRVEIGTQNAQTEGLATQVDTLGILDCLLSPGGSTQKPASGPPQAPGQGSYINAGNQDRANYQTKNKGKQTRKHGHSDGDDGNSQGNHRGNPKIKISETSLSNEVYKYACPYRKWDPTRFGKVTIEGSLYEICGKVFRDTTQIEQHLKEKHHYSDNECCRCFKRFASVGARDDHLRDDNQRCENVPTSKIENEMWLTNSSPRKARLKKIGKKNPSTSVQERWMQIWDAIFQPRPRPDSPYWEANPQQDPYQRTMEMMLQEGIDQALAQSPGGSYFYSMAPVRRANTMARQVHNLIENGELDRDRTMNMPLWSRPNALDVPVATPSANGALTPSSGSFGYQTQSDMGLGTPMSFDTTDDSAINQQNFSSHNPQFQYDFNFADTAPMRQPNFGPHLEPTMPGTWPVHNNASLDNYSEPGPSRYRQVQQHQSHQRQPLYGYRQQQRPRQQPPQ